MFKTSPTIRLLSPVYWQVQCPPSPLNYLLLSWSSSVAVKLQPIRGQYPGHVITLDQSVAVKLQGAGKMSTFTIFRLLCNIWLYFLSYPPNEMTHQNLFKVQSMCPAQVLPPECGRRSMSCIDHTLNECDSKIYEQLILQVGSVILITILLLGLKGCFVIWWLLSLSLWACLLINDVFQKLCV